MERDEGNAVSIACGGPVFYPKLKSPLTSTPDFEREMFHAVEELKAALGPESPCDADEEELSVDELRVFTDEELMSMFMKEEFKEDKPAESSTSEEESYLEKVKELAKIRKKQNEDRASAQLHSLKNRNKDKQCAAASSENFEGVTSLESIRCPTKIKPTTTTREHVSIRYPETVLFIEVYSNKKSTLKTQEIVVLGQQKLTELKDAIHCVTDAIMREANQHDPSGYFLIEDLFCNDMRDPSAIDYSKPILDWLKNSKEEALEKWEHIVYFRKKPTKNAVLGEKTKPLPHFRASEMQKALFSNLKFHVGARYLYCHQGDCKHKIVIRDMRLLHPEDCQNRAAYPLVGFEHKFRIQKCSVCQLLKATCFTVDDIYAGENPCYFCDNCYYLLHYDKNGVLQYEHVVHKYIHGV